VHARHVAGFAFTTFIMLSVISNLYQRFDKHGCKTEKQKRICREYDGVKFYKAQTHVQWRTNQLAARMLHSLHRRRPRCLLHGRPR